MHTNTGKVLIFQNHDLLLDDIRCLNEIYITCKLKIISRQA